MRSVARSIAFVLMLVPVAAIAWQKPAASKPAPRLSWPAAVETAFKQAYPNATVKSVAKDKEKGVDIYEVESVDNGRRRDLMYKPDGTVISYEEEVAAADVPAAVSGAIKTRYPKATLGLCEKLMEGTTMKYEIQVKGVPKVTSVELMPDGTWVSPKASK